MDSSVSAGGHLPDCLHESRGGAGLKPGAARASATRAARQRLASDPRCPALLFALVVGLTLGLLDTGRLPAARADEESVVERQEREAKRFSELARHACPHDMVLTRDVCVDRYEASMVDRDTGEPLSPYYPPHPKLLRAVFSRWDHQRLRLGRENARHMPLPALSSWQRVHDFVPLARSQPGRVPQAYVSYHTAKRACESAGKRLCTSEEWLRACRGRWRTQYPYGNEFNRVSCNVFRFVHPAHALHGLASVGQLDPRLNLIVERGEEPLLRETGASKYCKSAWWNDDGAYDMVGNLDEWVSDERGVFRGGFFARATTKGCEAQVSNHSPDYFDYSTGARCCSDPRPGEPTSPSVQ